MASVQQLSILKTDTRPMRVAGGCGTRGVAYSNASRRHTRVAVASTTNGSAGVSTQISPQLLELLQNVALGVLTPADAGVQLSGLTAHPSVSKADAASASKAEFPEVVWGERKTAAHILSSLQRIATAQGMAAATRVAPDVAAQVVALDPSVTYNDKARMLILKSATVKQQKLPGSVALICAGTADERVVEECRVMLGAAGCYAFKLAESGVMGMHRIVQNLDAVKAADVVICITGMDGGLATVVAGLVEVPVIALPTSTGYGAAFAGAAPLLGALNSSAPGVTVVNIDSGFGASMAAWRILKNAARIRQAIASP